MSSTRRSTPLSRSRCSSGRAKSEARSSTLISATILSTVVVQVMIGLRRSSRQASLEVLHQGVAEHLLERTILLLREIVLAASRRHSKARPVGGPIARPAIPRWIDERLGEVDRVRVDALPIARQ